MAASFDHRCQPLPLLGTADIGSAQYAAGYYSGSPDPYWRRVCEWFYDDGSIYRSGEIQGPSGLRRPPLPAGLHRTGLRLQTISRLLNPVVQNA